MESDSTGAEYDVARGHPRPPAPRPVTGTHSHQGGSQPCGGQRSGCKQPASHGKHTSRVVQHQCVDVEQPGYDGDPCQHEGAEPQGRTDIPDSPGAGTVSVANVPQELDGTPDSGGLGQQDDEQQPGRACEESNALQGLDPVRIE